MKRVYVNESARVVVTVLDDSDGQFIGKARCNPADRWDEAIGREISLRRAQVKMLRTRERRLDKQASEYRQKSQKLENAAWDAYVLSIDLLSAIREVSARATPATAEDE